MEECTTAVCIFSPRHRDVCLSSLKIRYDNTQSVIKLNSTPLVAIKEARFLVFAVIKTPLGTLAIIQVPVGTKRYAV
jgi:hypothetical protein